MIGGTGDPATWARQPDVTPGGDGTATVYLKVTGRYAGDNYQVEASRCRPEGCGTGWLGERVFALSPIFTAWKHIHIERDRMFRRGGVLAEDYVPWPDCGGSDPLCLCTGGGGDPECCDGIGPIFCNQVVAYDWQNAAAGDQVVVFDELFTFETAPEIRSVTAVGSPDAHGLVRVTLDEGLGLPHLRAARVEPDPPEKYQPTFSNHKSAGFGVISGCDLSTNQLNAQDSCFYQADLRGVEAPYTDAFVEVYAPRAGMGAVPYLGPEWVLPAPPEYYRDFNETWFGRAGSMANYFHVIAGSRDQTDNDVTLWGWTDSDWNFSYIFRGSCEASGVEYGKSAGEVDNFTRDTTVHELGHQWPLNCCASDGHDTRDAWCEADGGCGPGSSSPEKCVENGGLAGTIWDSVSRFCKEDLFPGDPLCGNGSCIQGTVDACPRGDTSVRRAPDPQ